MISKRRVFLLAGPWLLVLSGALGQESQSAPVESKPANPIQSSVGLFKLLQEKSVVFPDLATNQAQLSSWQKFKLAANNSVALSTVGAALIGSGYSQATNRPSGYHQGMEGYAKRFGADMARASSDNLFGTFLMASALHQDPRFYVKKNLSFGQTVQYAALRVAFTSSDGGQKQVNYSGLLGILLSEGLANAYYPEQNRSAGATFSRCGTDLAWRFGGNMLRQYWPVINKKLRLAPETSATP